MKITPALIPSSMPGPARKSAAEAPAGKASGSSRETPDKGLAASIMADGGLGFLQSRLQEKLEESLGRDEAADSGKTGEYGRSEPLQSPEAVADRIVGFALGLRQAYDRQNASLSEEERRAGFEAEVRRGIAEGFDHARHYLRELQVDSEEVLSTADRTWELIQQKLEEVFTGQDPIDPEIEPEAEPATTSPEPDA
jgi:hypothetical protein